MAKRNTVDDADQDAPVKKKKKKKKASSGNTMLILIVGGVVLGIVILSASAATTYFLMRDRGQPPAQANAGDGEPQDNRDPKRIVVPPREDGNPAKKGGKGVVNNIRGAVFRAERRNELANINKMHTAWQLEPGPKTLDGYLAYIQRDYRPVHDAIKEGYYRVNVKAKSGTSDIVAGERDEDTTGHLVVRGNGSIEHIPVADWKKAMP